MQTLVTIGAFESNALKMLGKEGYDELLEVLARQPKAGVIIPDTGGLRKIRFARQGAGKSGGARVIYYFYNHSKPVILLSTYAKADQEDLTSSQRLRLRKLVDKLVKEFN